MSETVLDASTVLAAVLGEPGAEALARLTGPILMSTVNYAEVKTRLFDLGIADEDAEASISTLGLDIVAFDLIQANRAAQLRQVTRAAGLSLGDRACLALAQTRQCPALTADRAWQKVDLPLDVRFIR